MEHFPIKELPLKQDVLSMIPQKIFHTFTSTEVEITCFDVTDVQLVFGTNAGCAFLYNRSSGHIVKLLCDSKHDHVSSVKLLVGLDCQVAIGTSNGSITIVIFSLTATGTTKQIRKFSMGKLHSGKICALEWSRNGMNLFSGYSDGAIYRVDVNFEQNTCSANLMCTENDCIVQLQYRHKLLLVATVEKTVVYKLDGQVVPIGSKPNRSGDYGACFNMGTLTEKELKVFASRPGMRIWIADIEGCVKSTLILNSLIQESANTIQVSGANSCDENNPQFGHLLLFDEAHLITYHGSSLYVINHVQNIVAAVCHGLSGLMQVQVTKDEIFMLRSGKKLHRLSWKEDSSGPSDGVATNNDSFNLQNVKGSLLGLKKNFSPFLGALQSKMNTMNIKTENLSNKIQLQTKELKEKVVSIPMAQIADSFRFTNRKQADSKSSDPSSANVNQVQDDTPLAEIDEELLMKSRVDDLQVIKQLLSDVISLIDDSGCEDTLHLRGTVIHPRLMPNPFMEKRDKLRGSRDKLGEIDDGEDDSQEIVFSSKIRKKKKKANSSTVSSSSLESEQDEKNTSEPQSRLVSSSDAGMTSSLLRQLRISSLWQHRKHESSEGSSDVCTASPNHTGYYVRGPSTPPATHKKLLEKKNENVNTGDPSDCTANHSMSSAFQSKEGLSSHLFTSDIDTKDRYVTNVDTPCVVETTNVDTPCVVETTNVDTPSAAVTSDDVTTLLAREQRVGDEFAANEIRSEDTENVEYSKTGEDVADQGDGPHGINTTCKPSPNVIEAHTHGSSEVHTHGSSEVHTHGSSEVHTHGSSEVQTHGSSEVQTHGSSEVQTHGSSEVQTHDRGFDERTEFVQEGAEELDYKTDLEVLSGEERLGASQPHLDPSMGETSLTPTPVHDDPLNQIVDEEDVSLTLDPGHDTSFDDVVSGRSTPDIYTNYQAGVDFESEVYTEDEDEVDENDQLEADTSFYPNEEEVEERDRNYFATVQQHLPSSQSDFSFAHRATDLWNAVSPTKHSITSLAASGNIICLTTHTDRIYLAEDTNESLYNTKWLKLSKRATQVSISPSEDFAWIVTRSGNVYSAHLPINFFSTNLKVVVLPWKLVCRKTIYVTVGVSEAWLVSQEGKLSRQVGLSSAQPSMEGGATVYITIVKGDKIVRDVKIKQVALTDDVAWLLTSGGDAYCKARENIDDSKPWQLVDLPTSSDGEQHPIKAITSDYQHTVWVTNDVGELWFRSKVNKTNPHGGTWWQVYRNKYIQENIQPGPIKSLAVVKETVQSSMAALVRAGNQTLDVAVSMKAVWLSSDDNKLHVARSAVTGNVWRASNIYGISPSTRWSHIASSSVFSPENGGWEGVVWAARQNGEIMRFLSSLRNNGRQQKAIVLAPPLDPCPPIRCLAPCRDALWVIVGESQLYVRSGVSGACPTGTKWNKVDVSGQLGTRKLVHMSCGSQSVWGLDDTGHVYLRMGVTFVDSHVTMSPAWLPLEEFQFTHSDGKFVQISCSPSDLSVWALDNLGNIYARQGVTGELPIGEKWVLVQGSAAKQLSISNHTVWALRTDGSVLQRYGITRNDCVGDYWSEVPVNFRCITATPYDELWAIDMHEQLRGHMTKIYHPPLMKAMHDVDDDDDTEDDIQQVTSSADQRDGSDEMWVLV